MDDSHYRAIAGADLNEFLLTDPEAASIINKIFYGYREAVIKNLLSQEHIGKWMTVNVQRKKSTVELRWSFHPSAKSPQFYAVRATMLDVALVPNYTDKVVWIFAGQGSGETSVDLEEGHSYYFDFKVLDQGKTDAEEQDRKNNPTNYIDVIDFQIAIPLSDERKELLRNAAKIVSDVREKARHGVQSHLDLMDTFDEMYSIGVDRIKAKDLSSREKKKRIDELTDKIKWMKTQMGL